MLLMALTVLRGCCVCSGLYVYRRVVNNNHTARKLFSKLVVIS